MALARTQGPRSRCNGLNIGNSGVMSLLQVRKGLRGVEGYQHKVNVACSEHRSHAQARDLI